VPFLTKSVEKPKTATTSADIELALEERLVEIAVLADVMETTATNEINAANEAIADLESRIAVIQKGKMFSRGQIERAAALRAQFQPIVKKD
jgi:hypothetical protein